MKLNEILTILKDNNLLINTKINNEDVEILDITYNSKACIKNSAFFVKGVNFKEEYIQDAINNGAVLVIAEKEYNIKDCDMVVVNNVRLAMALIAKDFFGNAFNNINLVGLTGTKGKTTTTYFIKNILDEYLGTESGVISTVETYTGKRREESHLTTPEAIELQRYLKEMVDSKIKFATMEVASQAYKVDRVVGMTFDTGVFLNISEDHISDAEHPNFNDYFDCKLQFIRNCRTVIINRETDFFEIVKDNAKNAERVITYGIEQGKGFADYYVDNIEKLEHGFKFTVHHGENSREYRISMQGRFNVENALAAIVVARAYNIPEECIERGLMMTEVQGRMNVYEKDGITVIVDYAHNKLSFTKFFDALKLDYPGRRIITVAGGPGGKAYARRKDLGEIAGAVSSYMYLTEEDPQFEETINICRDIAEYVKCPYEIIPDRKEAVETAIKNAKSGDIVALLAKGEEDYIKRRGVFVPYESDVNIVKRLFGIEK
ncbi:MAG: UDP-N-acetylmuramoyl-L-alanyl-D-glutamate--2,6-diaminopimelate ligase [Clostridia bacterium]|nr:UDP-N-acetylmuramoyl-L-alanyl-D-glutamate--2,6-diaminopimelate ligase [Clostridia bacterium]